MKKFKVFLGSGYSTADEKANEWLEEHPNVEIIDYIYKQDKCWEHSICILYRELKMEN